MERNDPNRGDTGVVLGSNVLPHAPLPREERQQFLARRKLKDKRSLNDLVEEVFLTLVEDATFLGYLDATWDSEAIEGSLAADNFKAAEYLRQHAVNTKRPDVANLKIATIARVLNVVVKRYGMSRKERRYTVGGEYVQPDDNNVAE